MRKLLLLLLLLNVHSAYSAAARSEPLTPQEELEQTKQTLEAVQELLSNVRTTLGDLRLSVGKIQMSGDEHWVNALNTLEEAMDPMVTFHLSLNKTPWAPQDSETQTRWEYLQDNLSVIQPKASYTGNIWDLWNEPRWNKKEAIISSATEGDIWHINPELGNFLVPYMQAYTDIERANRHPLTKNVGNVVPSLYGHGISLSKKTLKNSIQELLKIWPKVGQILQAKYEEKFGTQLPSAMEAEFQEHLETQRRLKQQGGAAAAAKPTAVRQQAGPGAGAAARR